MGKGMMVPTSVLRRGKDVDLYAGLFVDPATFLDDDWVIQGVDWGAWGVVVLGPLAELDDFLV
jgi:hypothetical protein